MKTIGQLNLLAVALLYRLASLLVLNTSQAQTPPKMKMATDIPRAITLAP